MTNQTYFPPKGDWATISPAEAGFDPAKLDRAVQFSLDNEYDHTRSLGTTPLPVNQEEPEEYKAIVGPTKDRTGPNGLIIRGGRIVARWGEVDRADMTYSCTKSYLSSCSGLAYDDGLLPDFTRPVKELVDDGGFEPPHNSQVTWEMLLQQSSEWEGELWGKPDWLDRNRILNPHGQAPPKDGKRDLQQPGTFFEYNDVRVNRTALALLRLWNRPLPELLKERIMDPIGASDSWEWHGYENSYIDLNGQRVQSVSGGAHWGGGLFIPSLDHARFGLLLANRGNWNGRQLLSEKWIDLALSPSKCNPDYGYMIWLNTTGQLAPNAPKGSFFARGAGGNQIWVEPGSDLVVVFRWMAAGQADGFYKLVMDSMS